MLPSISAEPGLQDHAGNFVGEDQAMIWFEHPTGCVIGSTAAIIQKELFGQERFRTPLVPPRRIPLKSALNIWSILLCHYLTDARR